MTDAHKIQTRMITEHNMVITFTDFIQNLASYHFVYTQDETTEMLQDSIHKLKEVLPPEQMFLIFKKSTKIRMAHIYSETILIDWQILQFFFIYLTSFSAHP